MRRSRKFLSLIIFLLVLNTLFFVAWYAFDAQGRVKAVVEREAGRALKGDLRIGSFSISDQQVFAEQISFAAADSSMNFTLANARVRFNLLRFLFSGFKMRNLMDRIEIDQADVQLAIVPKPPKTKQKFEIPDLIPIFNDLRITNSRFRAEARIPLAIGEEGLLTAIEQLDGIDLKVVNTKVSTLSLSATSAYGGDLKVIAVLDRGRLIGSRAELRDYRPMYVSHPQISDFTADLDLVASASQRARGEKLDLNAQLSLQDASAMVWGQYPVSIPLLDLSTDGDVLSVSIAQSSVGTSSFGGELHARDILGDPALDLSQFDLMLDLAMLGPQFSGVVDATLSGQGSLSAPGLDLVAGSDRLAFSGQNLQNLSLSATYDDKKVDISLHNAIWQNQRLSFAGIFDTQSRALTGKLDTTPVNLAYAEMKFAGSADLELNFVSSIPDIRARINNLAFSQNELDYQGLSGQAELIPLVTGNAQNWLLDVGLSSPLGIDLSLIGDINDSFFLLEAELNSLKLAGAYPHKTTARYQPLLSGGISAFLSGSQVVMSGDLAVVSTEGLDLSADLDLIASYDLKAKSGDLVLDVPAAEFNGQPLALELVAQIRDQALKLKSLRFNDQLLASGELNLDNTEDMNFQLVLDDVGSDQLISYFPNLELPEINGVDLTARYSSRESALVDAVLSIGEINIPGLKPLSAELSLLGDPQLVDIEGAIRNETRQLIDLAGDAVLDQGWNLRLNALATDLDMAELMFSPVANGAVSGNVGLFVSDVLTAEREISFDARLQSSSFSIPNVVDLDEVLVSVAQTRDLLIVDTLSFRSGDLGSVTGSGALDYNILSDATFEGTHTLDLQAEGLLFEWLDHTYDYVRQASGKANLVCSLSTRDDQLLVKSGKLLISEGSLDLEDQPEVIRNIRLDADILDNQVQINELTAQMGNGVLHATNRFEDDPDLHLKVAMLDLGTLLAKVDEPGALLYVPDISTPRSRARVVLRGQNSEYATITGPFDDMQITAEVLVSDASLVYPLNTNNLLNLIYSFRGSLGVDSGAQREAIPLPFNVDLNAIVQDNVKYATYPTNFVLQPGGYMHILFDGRIWLPQEANIHCEQGSMDFFGTKFSVESLDFSITGAQKMVILEGLLNHETADGTIITLNVDTDRDKPAGSIFKRVIFTLDSDNPDDVSVANIIGRMRYNASSEQLSATQQGNLLQDEALSLISENLNTSLLSPVLYPLENNIRRWLRLDDFSISAGFIQNLFTEYSTDPNQLANYADMGQFMGNISQFSSSILLNNLSIYMSKYLGRKFFLDYTLTLQEATNLQNRTEIVVSHDTSLRWYLPQQLRLSYTFQYEPSEAQMSHELMLQRSFKFWGL